MILTITIAFPLVSIHRMQDRYIWYRSPHDLNKQKLKN